MNCDEVYHEEMLFENFDHLSEAEEEIHNMPPALRKELEIISMELLPEKSRKLYNATYDSFKKWTDLKKVKSISENVLLAYFLMLFKIYRPSTLWAKYSMLKATLKIHDNIDINTYGKVTALLKRKSVGFRSKKSKLLTNEEVEKFINEAPNHIYLATKTALIFGVMGGMRTCELMKVDINDIEEQGDMLVVHIPDTKTHTSRMFTIYDKQMVSIVWQYKQLRPNNVKTTRFFLNFQNQKCTIQPIGKNKLAKFPQDVASFLNLPDVNLYIGHCYRRTSATLLANSGADAVRILNHGSWKSLNTAQRYIENSRTYKKNTAELITSIMNLTDSNENNLIQEVANDNLLQEITTEVNGETMLPQNTIISEVTPIIIQHSQTSTETNVNSNSQSKIHSSKPLILPIVLILRFISVKY